MDLDQNYQSATQSLQSKLIRKGNYQIDSNPFIIEAPKNFTVTREEEIDESEKKIQELRATINNLNKEIDYKKVSSEKEVDEILEKADNESERIVKEAEKSAFERVQKSIDEKKQHLEEQQNEAQIIIDNANQEASQIIEKAKKEAEELKKEIEKKGFEEGIEKGFEEGKLEVKQMYDRLKNIIVAMIDERERIVVHSERQIMNLILTMTRRVVKKLTKEQEDIIRENIKASLEIIHGATKIYIHVNPEDYEFADKHKQTFIDLIEGQPQVKFIENPSIERGGTKIETDIGEVDATISTQLDEIENQIKYYIPLKVKTANIDNEPQPEDETKAQATEDTDESDTSAS